MSDRSRKFATLFAIVARKAAAGSAIETTEAPAVVAETVAVDDSRKLDNTRTWVAPGMARRGVAYRMPSTKF